LGVLFLVFIFGGFLAVIIGYFSIINPVFEKKEKIG